MPALGSQFESSKYHDIPAVQTGFPPSAFAEASAGHVSSREIYHLWTDTDLQKIFRFFVLRGWALADKWNPM